jgi:hypothetical protein
VIVLGWSLTIVLLPVKYFVSPSISVAIQYVKATGMAVAFVAALDILLRYFETRKAQS